ncbi:MAG: site-2 protease family protein [Patescibacteria group bacterium]
MSVVIHEVSHGYAAYLLGDPTAKNEGRLTLNPLAHLDFLGSFVVPVLAYLSVGFMLGWAKPVPYNPYNLKNQRWGDAIVAFAGPASNLLVALFFGLFLRLGYLFNFLQLISVDILVMVILINLVLAIFNLIPVPPLDGSKILFSFLPYHYIEFKQTIERYSLFLMLFVIFFLWQFIFPLISFIFYLITGVKI